MDSSNTVTAVWSTTTAYQRLERTERVPAGAQQRTEARRRKRGSRKRCVTVMLLALAVGGAAAGSAGADAGPSIGRNTGLDPQAAA